MRLRITIYDESVLRQKGDTIEQFDEKIKKIASDLVDTVKADNNCIGLSAQQVGYSLQLFVSDLKSLIEDYNLPVTYTLDGKVPPLDVLFPLVVFNPKVEALTDEIETEREACMSLPGLSVPVTRAVKIKLTYQDVDGNPHILVCDNFFARNVLHEYDHAQGILIIDRTDQRSLVMVASKLKKLKRQTRDFLKSQSKKE